MIPGWVISLLTFPGVIVHEMAHQFFCRLYRLPVYDVCYFRTGDPAGYVVHEPAQTYGQSFWISVGPLVIGTLLTVVVGFPMAMAMDVTRLPSPIFAVLGWLAVSIGMHAFPSSADANYLWSASREALAKGNATAMIGFPLVMMIRLANLLSFAWFDAIYAVGVMMAVSWLIIRLVARI